MIFIFKCADPLLIVQTKRKLNWFRSLNLNSSLLFLRHFFVTKEPWEWRYDNFKSFSCALPLGRNFTVSFFISSTESHFLDWCIVETGSTDENVGTTNLWPKVWFNFFNANIIVAEIYGLSSELLAIQSKINRISHILRIVTSNMWHSCNNATILVETLCTGPCVIRLLLIQVTS